MGPLGRHFVWRSIAGVQGNEVSSELAVLTFKGRCDVAGIIPRETHPGALGWTHVSDGAILPFSDIDCDRIRDFIQKELVYHSNGRARDGVSGERWPAWSRMSCITFSPIRRIMAPTASERQPIPSQELMSDDFQFEEREGDALRTSVPTTTSSRRQPGT